MLIDSQSEPIWTRCLESLMSKIPETAFVTWFSNLECVDVKDNILTIGTPNNFVLDYVSHHYQSVIQSAVRETLQFDVNVQFINLDKSCNSVFEYEKDQGLVPESYSGSDVVTNKKTTIDSSLALNPGYTFQNFVVGDCNQFAHAACLAVSAAPSNNNFNPLIIYGVTGLGKTHLLQAVAQFILDAETARKVVYRTSEEFTREYIKFVINKKDSRSFYRVYKDADVLLIDDIQFLAGKEATQEEFYNIFSNIQQLNKQVIITSDREPNAIKGLHKRLLSRFDTGLPANLQPPRLETRLAILKKKQENDKRVFLTEEVLAYVANSITSNIRELEGTLIKLTAYARFTLSPITVEIAKQVLGDTIRNKNKPVTLEKIIEQVSREFDIPVDHITSQSRKKHVAEPRQIAMHLARQLTDNSLPTIGLAFGRDYSTVIHSLKKIESILPARVDLMERIRKVKDRIMSGC